MRFIGIRRQLLAACLLVPSIGFGQDIVFEKDMTLGTYYNNYRETYAMVDNNSKDFVLILFDNLRTSAYAFNSNFENTSMLFVDKKSDFKSIIGYTVKGKEYNLIHANDKRTKLKIQTFSLGESKIYESEIKLKYDSEVHLKTIQLNNNLYIITVKRFSSILVIREIQGNKLSRMAELDFSGYRYIDWGYSRLSDVIKNRVITTIKYDKPIPLGMAYHAFKIYPYDNQIVITLDNDANKTRILTINIDDLSNRVAFVDQHHRDCKKYDSNSFILRNLLFQITNCKEELIYTIYNLEDSTELKRSRITAGSELPLKNTAFVAEIGKKRKKKELDNIEEYLLSVSSRNLAITAFGTSEFVEVSVGGSSSPISTSTFTGHTPGVSVPTPAGTVSSPGTDYSYSVSSISPLADLPATYFKVLLDPKTLEHIDGLPVENTALQKVNDYPRKHHRFMSMISIFSVGETYLFGYYNKVQRKYTLRKFEQPMVE